MSVGIGNIFGRGFGLDMCLIHDVYFKIVLSLNTRTSPLAYAHAVHTIII